jgi:xylan 1,4-beta-xylosidase
MPFTNPVIPGFYPDPSVCRVDDDYYLVTSSFEYFPGVPIFHSKDLVNWRQIGHVLTRDIQLPLQGARYSGGIYAPTIRHHDGKFCVITTNVSQGGNFFVTAEDPAGEWSEPVWVDHPGIDPSLLFDDDGRVYLTSNGNRQFELDVDTGKALTSVRTTWAGTGGGDMEAPHLYKLGDMYYLLVAEGGTARGHMVTAARSSGPWGPFESCPHNPILSNRGVKDDAVQATGHADLVQAHDGSWWVVFLAVRDLPGEFPHVHTLGRETFLAPVTWTADGWPVVNTTGTVREKMDAATLPLHPWPAEPARDDFDASHLRFCWNFRRNPAQQDWSLSDRPGWLRLHGSAVTLNDQASPSAIFRRQQHFGCEVSTLLEFEPSCEGEEAGLTVLMNDHHHYDLAVGLWGSERTVRLHRRIGDLAATTSVASLPPGPVILGITADPVNYTFWSRSEGSERTLLGTGLTRYLSSEVATGFTGVYFGLYATGNGSRSEAPADFDWFEYAEVGAG